MTPPRRQLGLGIAAAIVVANMIGTGIFTSTGFQAASLHDPATMLFTWFVGGVLALCGAACYAELGSMMPRAGGEYVYLREAYHPAVGFMSGWVSLTAGFSAPIAAAALAFSKYSGKVIPALDGKWEGKLVAAGLIVAISSLHAFDTKLGGRVQTAFTIGKASLIAVFILAGLLVGDGDWSNLGTVGDGLAQLKTWDGLEAFATSMMWVSLAYSGWNAAAYIAGEIEHPQRTLPRALLLGTGLVMVLYLLLNVVFLYSTPPGQMAGVEEVGDLAARNLFGESFGRVLSTLVALALVSSVSAMLMAGPRVYAAMAADRALPRILATYNERGVPQVAVVTQTVLAIAFVFIGDLDKLVQFVGFTLSIFAALTVSAVFVFRLRKRTSPYRTWGYPVTPAVFIALSLWFVYLRVKGAPKESAIVGVMLVVGAVIYALTSKGMQHTKIEEDE
ncbi:MAG: APC family permease [Deltaproteobacteria bacterium]|nr:APC family permease [Deltaproteobacteria bacterium]MCW5805090.1 APC family permease [Deltaproteobacteria bacterium]